MTFPNEPFRPEEPTAPPTLVSIVLPTYNRGYCIDRALDSVLRQTYANFELLVVDDGSTDNTAAIICERYGRDPRFKYFVQKQSGVSVARNLGLRQARGKYVAFVDSDDVWKPWKLDLQIACMEFLPEDVGMIWTDMEAVDRTGRVFDPRHLRNYYRAYRWFGQDSLFRDSYNVRDVLPQAPPEGAAVRLHVGDIFSQMLMGNLVHTPTVVLRRTRLEKVRGFDESMLCAGGDYDFHLRTCREGEVAFLDVSAIQYQCDVDDRLSHPRTSLERGRNFLKTISGPLAQDRARIDLPSHMIDNVLAEAHGWIGEAALDRGLRTEARTHLFESLRRKPLQPRLAVLGVAALLPGPVASRLRSAYRRTKSLLRATPSPVRRARL